MFRRLLVFAIVFVGLLSAPGVLGQVINPTIIQPFTIVAASDASSKARSTADYVCDGTRDEVQIQAALDAAAARGGGIVALSEGTFVCSDAILFHDSVGTEVSWGLVGQGPEATIVKSADGSFSPILMPRAENCARLYATIRDLTFDGNRTGVGDSESFAQGDVSIANDTITVTGHSFTSGDEVFFDSDGTISTNVAHGTTAGNRFYVNVVDINTVKIYTTRADAEGDTGTNQIDFTDQGSAHAHYVGRLDHDPVLKFNRIKADMRNVDVKNGHGSGIYSACYRSLFDNVRVLYCNGSGVTGTGVGGSVFRDCLFQGNGRVTGHGVGFATNSFPVMFRGCVFSYNGSVANAAGYGAYVSGSKQQFIDCRFYGNATEGLYSAATGDDLLVMGCLMWDNAKLAAGQNIVISSDHARIVGNHVGAARFIANSTASVLNKVTTGDFEGVAQGTELLASAVWFLHNDANYIGVKVRVKPDNTDDWAKLELTFTYTSWSDENNIVETMTWLAGDETTKYLNFPAKGVVSVVLTTKTLNGGSDVGAGVDVGNYNTVALYPIGFVGSPVGAVITGNIFTGHGTLDEPSNLGYLSGHRLIEGNDGASQTGECRTAYAKNVSGGELVQGDVVVMAATAGGNEFTTTTVAGDGMVLGMLDETVANDAWGHILVLGKTVHLKVDGTDNIAIGDLLSAFTTAKIAQKAAGGEVAFAVALEVYETNDSAGVIDALLITPRQMQ